MLHQSEKNGGLARKLLNRMGEITRDRHGDLAIANARKNLSHKHTGESLAALRRQQIGDGDRALIVAAGPSIRRQDTLRKLAYHGFEGAIIATESAMRGCLLNGIVPDLVVTLDPHVTRIVRWFGSPQLTESELKSDDYFRRQEQDEAFASEMRANEEILGLLDRYGSRIKIALASSASEAVVSRVLECGMEIYWWNPMLDDPDEPDSVTLGLMAKNGWPCVNAGGNVGTAAWMMATEVLEKKTVALTGMDFGYYSDTAYENTQYYNEAVALVGKDNLDSLFVRFDNPNYGAWFFTDPAYFWYRESFLELVADSDSKTVNCTEGGILFGEGIDVASLTDFLTSAR
ncbi:MAG: 6-hydroxymethylpterin diphosphokinase MptE-like protein [Planctomycetaceae bacterium]